MKILSIDELVICEGDQPDDWYSLSNDVHGLPGVTAQLARRSGRQPNIGNIEYGGRQFTIASYLPSATATADKKTLLAWLNSRATRRVVGTDVTIPSAATAGIVAAFGPWDIYNDAGTRKVRDVLRGDSREATLAGGWWTTPGGGLGLWGSAATYVGAMTTQIRQAVGTELLVNGGFETAGGGGADVFGTWTETAGTGAIARTTTASELYAGAAAAKLTAGASTNTNVYQTVTVTPGKLYRLAMRSRGDGTYAGQYKVYDVTNSADIVATRSTGVTSTSYTYFENVYVAPAGCVSLRVYLWCPATNAGVAYFDAVSLTEMDPGACTLANPLSSTAGSVVLWWTPNVSNAGLTRYLFDEGGFSAYFNAADDKIYFTDGTNAISTAALTFNAGTTLKLAFTWATGALAIYRDGASVATGATYTAPTLGATLFIGSDTASANQCDGTIKEFRALSVALSSTEAIYLTGQGASGARWLNAACLDAKPTLLEGRLVDGVITALMQVDGDTAWRQRDGDFAFWHVLASGSSVVVDNQGNVDAYPVVRITPKTAKSSGGFSKMRYVPVTWNSDNAATVYPIDVSNGGLDLSADAQADGDDIRVYVDGTEVDRWIDGTLVTDVTIWVNMDFDAQIELSLDGAITDAADTLTLNESIDDLPETGTVLIGTEVISYTERDTIACTLSGLTRGAKDTTAAAHDDDAVVEWLQHDVWIYYGDSSLAAPVVDDDYKPVFNMATSTNGSWVYAEFGEDDGLRAGNWTFYVTYTPSRITANEGGTADPWSVIGVTNLHLSDDPYPATLNVRLYNDCGFTGVAWTNGKARANNNASHFTLQSTYGVGLSEVNADYVHTISSPDTWEAWSDSSTFTRQDYVGLYVKSTSTDYAGYMEASNCTVTIDATTCPVAAPGAAQSAYQLDCSIANGTTGQTLALNTSILIDQTVIVDTDAKTIVLSDGTGALSAKSLDAVRVEWLPLQPGENTLTFTDVGSVSVEVELYWDRRNVE